MNEAVKEFKFEEEIYEFYNKYANSNKVNKLSNIGKYLLIAYIGNDNG